ncbi:DUF1631 domain-containing protein [Porticoccaceae bacterium]|nr:DUF1631 domain-containing protein [Porticoccaceae bacterium]
MGKGSHQLQQLLKTLRHHCQQHLSCAFDKFQPIFTSKLAELAKNAPTNRLQTLYLDTQRLLRLQVAEIEQQTIANALKPLSLSDRSGDISHRTAEIMALGQSADDQDAANSTGTNSTGTNSTGTNSTGTKVRPGPNTSGSIGSPRGSLKLVEHDDLEVMIALDNSSSSVREALGSELYELEGRFKSLFVDSSNSNSPLALSPDALLEAFANALDNDLIALEVQLELVKIFAEVCFDSSYGELLCLVIDQLVEGGFELVKSSDADHRPAGTSARLKKDQFREPEPDSIQSESVAAEQADLQPINSQSSIPVEGVKEQSPAYGDEPLIANTRIQTELLAKISSMLENAEEDAQLEMAQRGNSLGTSLGTSPGTPLGTSSGTASERAAASLATARRPCMDKPQLFAEINKHINHLVTHHSELASNGQITRDLAAAIKQLSQGEEGSRLHRNDASVFQVVENTFASFGESMVVAPEVRQVINRCEVPMLKLALKKPVLFEQENHPIRRLFNEMAKYAIGLEQGDCEDNKIYQQMLKLAENMSADSFDERNLPLMLSEFMSIIDRDKRVTSVSEKHEIERVAAREKINWARTRVEQEVAKRMVGKSHAQEIIDFVQRSWCLVLHMAHQQKGEVSSDWQVALKLLDNLLYLASRPATEKDLKYRHELIKHLDVRLGHISTDIAQRSLKIQQLSDALGLNPEPPRSAKVTEIAPAAKKWANKMVKKCRPGNSGGTGTGTADEDSLVGEVKRVLMSAVKTELPGKNIARAVQDAESIGSEAQRRLGAMKTGCWIELGGDIKAHKRGKLAGIVGPSWKYVFVDNQGKLIAERDRARLAVDILNGTVTVLDNSYLFDKAIKQAITQIKGLPVAS